MRTDVVTRWMIVCVVSLTLSACSAKEPPAARAPGVAGWPPGAPAYADSMMSWRAARLARLTSDTGWLTVAGIFWLSEGENLVGSAEGSTALLPADASPPRAAMLRLREGTITLVPDPAAGLTLDDAPITDERVLKSDADGKADVIRLGRLSFWIIKRADRYAVRLRDPEYALRKDFKGIDAYPVDPSYRVVARLEPYAPGTKIAVPNMLGYVDSADCPGRISFTLHGEKLSLLPTWDPGDSALSFVFADSTTGFETYGGGRFLDTDLLPGGTAVLDFNLAYNPPCAFNPNTTCPLPPEGNKLAFAVRAGEKDYKGAH